jgi:monoterpene epsilon-lactone hydrolase
MKLMDKIRSRALTLCGALALWAFFAPSPAAQRTPDPNRPKVVVDEDGTVHVPPMAVPVSEFLSPEGKAYLAAHLKAMQNGTAGAEMNSWLERQRVLFPNDREDTNIAGVHVFVYTPKAGIDERNKNRVLIDLHGGGFDHCWPGCAEAESMPMAGVGRFKVIAVDYRQGPKYKHPAGSEDVAAVYKEILKTYPPQNVAIYGCSAGGMLTAMSMAWFQTHRLSRPGAIGILCASAGQPGGMNITGGDAAFTTGPLGSTMMPRIRGGGRIGTGYFEGTDPNDPLVNPIVSPAVLSKFPPTLLITATRAMELSSAVYTHGQLVKAGVDAELHVWDGLFHGFWYNPDPPECKDVYDVMVRFFDRHLGSTRLNTQ